MTEERIPDAELEVLACVQRRGRATAREVREAIASWRPLSHSSVMTLLGRLQDRGLVARERGEGREYVYHATASREEAVEPIFRRLLTRVFEGDPAALVASLFETRPPDAREVDRLERLLAELRDHAGDEGDARAGGAASSDPEDAGEGGEDGRDRDEDDPEERS